jgi:hypothetical protein
MRGHRRHRWPWSGLSSMRPVMQNRRLAIWIAGLGMSCATQTGAPKDKPHEARPGGRGQGSLRDDHARHGAGRHERGRRGADDPGARHDRPVQTYRHLAARCERHGLFINDSGEQMRPSSNRCSRTRPEPPRSRRACCAAASRCSATFIAVVSGSHRGAATVAGR